MRILCLAAAGLALGACARPSCPPPRAFAGPGRPFLWTVSEGANDKRLILYGTLHAAGIDDVPRAALDALDGAPLFVSEIDDLPPDTIRAAATLPRGESLQVLLGDDAWYDLRDALTGVIGDEALRRVRPWYAMSLLTGASADLPAVEMDVALREKAKAQGKPLAFLETADEQLGALADSVTPADVKQALADRKAMRCAVGDLRAAYRAGDGQPLRDELGDAAAAKLLDARNQRWIAKLEEWLRGGGAFVAVGVAHLIGPGSLPELLAARGFRVERATK